MKTSQKFIFIVLALLLAVSSIASSFYDPRYYVQVKEFVPLGGTTTVAIGKLGVSYTESWMAGTVVLTRKAYSPIFRSSTITLRNDLAYVRFLDTKNIYQKWVKGPVYIFYELRGDQISQWKRGLVSIYAFSNGSNRWFKCPTYQVAGQYASQVRVACRITQYTMYGLGTLK